MRWVQLAIIATFFLTAHPLFAQSRCNDFITTTISDDNTVCGNAELHNSTSTTFCGNLRDTRGRVRCTLISDQSRCLPTFSALRLFNDCTRQRYARVCTGPCPNTTELQQRLETQYAATPAPEPPSFTPVLPRLQIPIPTLQPFTSPLKQTDEQGRTFLNVNFIGPYIIGLYKYLVGAASIIAGVMYVWAGVKWLTSAGSAEGIGDAKKKIAGASVGLILVLGSYVIINLINPELTLFKPLKVEFVERQLLEDFDGKDLETETIVPPMNIGDTTYDDIFQRFANCIPADWRFLKAIAYKESGLNTNKENPSHYIGLFQTNQANCESTLRTYPQHQSQCSNLTNPAVNTAVGALMMRSALQSIRGTCASAGTLEKLTMVYINHNMGPGVLRYAMDEGCTLPELRQGSINYYTTSDRGKRTAQSYATKYQSACLQSGNTAAQCTAGPKFDYAVSTARATQGLGVSQIDAPATGPCPLASAQPF